MPRTTAHLTTLCSTVALTALAACSKTPVTERIQFNLIPDVIMKPLGQSAYREMLAAESLEKGTNRHDTLKKVGKLGRLSGGRSS